MPATDDTVQVLAYAHCAIRMHRRKRRLTQEEQTDCLLLVCKITHRCWVENRVTAAFKIAYEAAVADLAIEVPWN